MTKDVSFNITNFYFPQKFSKTLILTYIEFINLVKFLNFN